MSQNVQVAGIYVHDQDAALDFSVGKLGFAVHTDHDVQHDFAFNPEAPRLIAI